MTWAIDVTMLRCSIDQGLDASAEKYRGLVPPATTLLLGPRYALLRREFLAARKRDARVATHVSRIVVSMGGSDPGNATGLAVGAALAGMPSAEIHVIAGPAYSGDLSEFEDRVQVHRSPQDMAILLNQADIVVGAAGTSTLERAYLGVPSIVLAIAENQLDVADRLSANGLAESLGWVGCVSSSQLSNSLRSLAEDPARRQAMRDGGMRVVDGLGATRIANHLDGVRLRLVRWSDAGRLLEWANDAETRRQSLSPETIEMGVHRNWLRANLADPRVDLLIAENGLGPVGALRLAPGWHGHLEVSINVAPGRRGGLGTVMLKAAMRRWDRLFVGQQLVARIKPGNLASERAFAHVGFRPVADAADAIVYTRQSPTAPAGDSASSKEAAT